MALSDADMVEFEDATAADLSTVMVLLVANGPEAVVDPGRLDAVVGAEAVFSAIERDPNQRLIVGWFGGRVVSCLQLSFLPTLVGERGRRAQIEAVRVERSMRGRGIGHVMVWWAVERSREAGCGSVHLTVERSSSSAERFFVRQGFEFTDKGMQLKLF